MKGIVVQFRRGRHTYKPRHFLLEFEGIDSKEKASKLVNMDVEWKSPGRKGKVIKGKIKAAHGSKGIVRAIFEKGLPGQAISTEIKIKGEIKEEKTEAKTRKKKTKGRK